MRVAVGVSGGADSVALLHLLHNLGPQFGLDLHVVHLNHMLRPEAAADAAFVQQLAHQWGLPVTVGCARVRTIAGRLKTGLEDAGRLARYRLFAQVADKVGAQRIAVGHHADDQVETVLFNIMRGTGPAGLSGIPVQSSRIIRPLLCVTKQEIEAYCRAVGLTWRTDESNLAPDFMRNKIRHRLLPLLRTEFNPHLDRALLRLADIMQEENLFFKSYVKAALHLLLKRRDGHSRKSGCGTTEAEAPGPASPSSPPGAIRLYLPAFLRLPLAVRRRLLREAVREAGGSLRRLGYQNIEDCLDFLDRGSVGGIVQLPWGVRVSKQHAYFTVSTSVRSPDGRACGAEGVVEKRGVLSILQAPGKTCVPELGLTIRARLVSITPGAAVGRQLWDAGDGYRACFDYDQLELPLYVRTRQAGDRIRPFGMQGAKKLKKFFGDFKIPVDDRDRIALVVSTGEILWAVGCRRGQAAAVNKQTRRVLVLEAENWSSSPPNLAPRKKN